MSTYSELILSHGPSNYWKLNESGGLTAVDSVGGAHGTISGGVTLSQPGALSDGTTAMLFNGTTGAVATAAAVVVPAAMTVEGWVKTGEGTAQRPMIGLGGSALTPYCGKFGTTMFVYTSAPVSTSLVGVGSIADGQWHHVVYVFQASGLTLYRDGVLDGSSALTVSVSSASVAEIGRCLATAEYWPGSLDEIAIYPRVLTPAEMSAHYAARLVTGGYTFDLNSAIATSLHTTNDLTTDVSVWLKANATGDATADFQRLIDVAS